MDRIAFAAAALFVAATPAAAAERRYTVTDFDRVQVDGPYRVTLTTGKPSAARAQGPHQALDRLSVTVEGRTLRVRPDTGWGGYPNEALQGPVTVEISTARLRYAGVSGAGILEIDRAKAMRLDLSLAGSGRIDAAAVDTDSLYLNLLGSGRLQIGGRTKTLRAEIHGSGDLAGSGLSAADAQVFADTAGTVHLQATRSVSVTSSATGDVEIAGKAACTVKALGTGRVRCGS